MNHRWFNSQTTFFLHELPALCLTHIYIPISHITVLPFCPTYLSEKAGIPGIPVVDIHVSKDLDGQMMDFWRTTTD
jgi:hypothetical protein